MNKQDLINLLKSGKILEAAVRGRKEVQALVPGYSPEGPHLATSLREDASKFNASSWSELIDIMTDQEGRIPEIQDNGGAIIAIVECKDLTGKTEIVGSTASCQPEGSGPWVIVRADHGLMARGQGVKKTALTDIITLIFTDEGENVGYVLATVHPGMPEEPGDYEGLEEGALLSMADLKERHITRVIPE